MTHELKQIFKAFEAAKNKNLKTVLATVVALEGSSYRRPGVRMLLIEDGSSVGAVSGGCVEKEVFRQAESVFKCAIPKVMTYDGRYRLGCEGILYILLEPFQPDAWFLKLVKETIHKRIDFSIKSYFKKEHSKTLDFGSVFNISNTSIPLQPNFTQKDDALVFEQNLTPCFKLVLIGAEHDVVQLCSYAILTGWEVTIIASPKEEKPINDFPGATNFIAMRQKT
jgi:xanthine/CO dehydrogenase XdhC/CoxF family maturation factor